MSDVINANPTILDDGALPTRASEEPKAATHGLDPHLASLLNLSLIINSHHHHHQKPTDSATPSLTSDHESDVESDEDEELEDPIDSQEIFDLVAHISDPEHPLTLGQLAVVNLPDINVIDSGNKNEMAEVIIRITPTITHCSLATLIGLGIRVRLERCLPDRFRITILLKEGSHQSENQVNKQLNDKERVAAACENEQLLSVISKMLASCK
ncbi:hypothetical protein WICANDRAFT_77215 [Wickerhamomyces anomalus NRRL Y-366-8]|uniref:Uncharacterized protein n=1 Tax=Wickerhamomyces anomalus (strain ATCC 58044 / CBS 1984 / NCYC 433 / NRRL Y-366-8) TaxID=683960 RepID=A0A1E3P5H9_WICAA|nr:uncharacterized protein WICANDRAFT_77215 [Wickerhamomyces anomalus NRRL Y-366-8]ODQ60530.1 hypothetical protein WICANDRAFT_77215 [Wickerhamomyces anomalus NRRL Y-366-8]